MEYKLVEIVPDGTGWRVQCSNVPGDRAAEKTKPSTLGFYYYPDGVSDRVAFEALRDKISADIQSRISALEKKLSELHKLKMPEE